MREKIPKIRRVPTRVPKLWFGIGGLGFLLAAVVAAFHSLPSVLPSLLGWTVGEAATACAGFATVSAVLFALYQFSAQWTSEASRFALNLAMQGVQQAHAVIVAQKPPTNIAWVNGARLLLRAQSVAENIEDEVHKAAWDLFKEEWRIKFHHLIAAPAEYYFGLPEIPDPEPHDLDYTDERLQAMMRRASYQPTIKMTGRSGHGSEDTMISPTALKIVFDFTRYPTDYEKSDRLRSAGSFSQVDIDELDMLGRWGLFAYLRARKKYGVAFGKVYSYDQVEREGQGGGGQAALRSHCAEKPD